LHRKMTEWEWYTDPNTCHLFQHLVLMAQHKATKFRGVILQPGQLITGRDTLSEQTGISVRSVRTSLKHLKSTNEVTIKTTRHFSVITIVKYKDYQYNEIPTNQQSDQQSDQQVTNNRPTTDHMQECKECKNVKKTTVADLDFSQNHKIYFDWEGNCIRGVTQEIMEDYHERYPGLDIVVGIKDFQEWILNHWKPLPGQKQLCTNQVEKSLLKKYQEIRKLDSNKNEIKTSAEIFQESREQREKLEGGKDAYLKRIQTIRELHIENVKQAKKKGA